MDPPRFLGCQPQAKCRAAFIPDDDPPGGFNRSQCGKRKPMEMSIKFKETGHSSTVCLLLRVPFLGRYTEMKLKGTPSLLGPKP